MKSNFILASALLGAAAFQSYSVPVVSLSRNSSGVTITYTGSLEAAAQIEGPWIALTNAANPFLDSANGTRRFYRSRESGGLFSGSSVISWSITGPFQTNFNLAFAGTPDGIVPPNRQKPYFDAQVILGTQHIPATMRVRGNSSLQECTFPKLKLKVSKENRANTPFAEAREIKIGTHCAEGGRGTIGRLRDERAAWREALAYEVMEELGFVSPRVRRAVIEYHDTGAPDEFASSGWTVSRHAVVLEDIELVADRLGGRPLDDEEIAAIKETPFAPQLITDLELFHALLGNWDFSVHAEERGLWNTDVIELADQSLLPVAGDFDLASWVTEIVRLSVPSEYHPELQDVERQVRYTLEDIRARSGTEHFVAGRERFLQHRNQIEAKINTAEIDAAGRTNALRHTAAFFNTIATLGTKP